MRTEKAPCYLVLACKKRARASAIYDRLVASTPPFPVLIGEA